MNPDATNPTPNDAQNPVPGASQPGPAPEAPTTPVGMPTDPVVPGSPVGLAGTPPAPVTETPQGVDQQVPTAAPLPQTPGVKAAPDKKFVIVAGAAAAVLVLLVVALMLLG